MSDDARTPTLLGRHVALVPLEHAHHDALVDAARDGELWQIWCTDVPAPDAMRAEIARRLALAAAGTMVPFTVRDGPDGAIVGMTTFMAVDWTVPHAEIGSTWYARRVQRTGLNTEAKLLLLRHAFEARDCRAVEFRTHVLNGPSRRAIERLGARFDGILRQHRRAKDGTIRDTAVYSIVAAEWPAVRSHLRDLLDRARS